MIFMPIQIRVLVQILTLLRIPLLGMTPVLILVTASILMLILKGFSK